MTLERDEITWGATVDAPGPGPGGPREWTVELESEPVAGVVGDVALGRFAHDAARRAPAATPMCSVTSGRFAMVLTIEASGADEAARKGGEVFELALGTALWPRSVVAPSGSYDVTVVPAATVAHVD